MIEVTYDVDNSDDNSPVAASYQLGRSASQTTTRLLALKAQMLDDMLELLPRSLSSVDEETQWRLALLCSELSAILLASKPLRRTGQLYPSHGAVSAAESLLRRAYEYFCTWATEQTPLPNPQPPLKPGWTYWPVNYGPIKVDWAAVDLPDFVEGTVPLNPA